MATRDRSQSTKRGDGRAKRAAPPAPQLSLREQAYERIRNDIFDGRLQAGEVLAEARLAETYGISRTPVREAIKQLAQVGLVRLVPNRGAFVAELVLHDVMEIYELREQLDGHAARAAAAALTDAELAELRSEAEEAHRLEVAGKRREAFAMAVETHRRITRASGNSRLQRILAALEDESRRLSHLTFRSPGRLEAALAEHVELIEALERHDGAGAEKTMRRHLRADRDAAIGQLHGGRVA